MPLYEYQCEACGTRFEKIRKFSDPPLEVCEHCGKGPVAKLVSSPAIQFKGTGWYITDYAKKPSPDSAAGKSTASTESSSSEAKKTETPAATTSSDKKD